MIDLDAYCNSASDKSNSIQYLFYIKKDYVECLKLIQCTLSDFKTQIKHCCYRNPKCYCINLGKMLIQICIDEHLDIIREFNVVYCHPEMNLPYELLFTLSKTLIKTFNFQSCYFLIHSYLTLLKEQQSLSTIQIRELTHILVFDCVMITEGITNAKLFVKSYRLIDNSTKCNFIKELEERDSYYTMKQKEIISNQCNSNKDNKLRKFKRLEFLSDIKNDMTFIGKISSILLNKKFMLLLLIHCISIIAYRIYNNLGISDSKLIQYIKNTAIVQFCIQLLRVMIFN